MLIPYVPSNGSTDGKNVYEWILLTISYIITAGLLGILILVYYKRKKSDPNK